MKETKEEVDKPLSKEEQIKIIVGLLNQPLPAEIKHEELPGGKYKV